MEEWSAAVNVPPLHPWCRCVLVPYLDVEADGAERTARNEEGKTERVDEQTYEEWKEKRIKGDEDAESAADYSEDVFNSGDVPDYRYATEEEYDNLKSKHESTTSKKDSRQILLHPKRNDLDVITDMRENVTIEEWKRWKWIHSSERTAEYILAIPYEQRTDQDWFDLRATDF